MILDYLAYVLYLILPPSLDLWERIFIFHPMLLPRNSSTRLSLFSSGDIHIHTWCYCGSLFIFFYHSIHSHFIKAQPVLSLFVAIYLLPCSFVQCPQSQSLLLFEHKKSKVTWSFSDRTLEVWLQRKISGLQIKYCYIFKFPLTSHLLNTHRHNICIKNFLACTRQGVHLSAKWSI